jgi:hypothetical protein
MTDNVSSELREVERQVDNEFLKNALMSEPFAQAAWHFFAHFEDHFARQYVHVPNDELHYHALADNLINHSRWALKWLSSTCPPSNRKPPAYDDDLYSHAMQLSELAMDYGPFTAAYTYASRGLVSLFLEDSRIRTSGPMIDDAQYEAYDHALMNKSDSSVLDGFDPSFMEEVHKSLRVRGHSFDYSLNPKIVQRAVESLRPTIDARFSLPDDWTFAMFTLDDFRRVARVLFALSLIHFSSRLSAALVGCPGNGIARALLLMESNELLDRLTRYSGIKRTAIIEIVQMLTYGSSGQKNADPALQPLIKLSPSFIAISPNLLMNSSIERNFSVLLNRLPAERGGYTTLSNTKEQAMISRLKAELSGLSFRFWSGCITRWATASEVDLAIICDDERRGLVLELKAFTAPADPREVCERSEEIEKGISQIRTRKAAFAAAPQFFFDSLGIDDTYTVSWAVVSETSIGAPYVQDLTIPVVNARHLVKRLRKDGTLAGISSWLENRSYLPLEGVHYRRIPREVRVGKWILDWYGVEVLADDYISP